MNKKILRIAIPFIISNITVPLVGTVDTSLMGYHGSQAQLGAIGLGVNVIFLQLIYTFSFFAIRGIIQTIYYKTANLERFFKQ